MCVLVEGRVPKNYRLKINERSKENGDGSRREWNLVRLEQETELRPLNPNSYNLTF